ncbi:MAG: divalent-cation tolerance protein CutA [Pseudomonadota bacterium]
MAVQVFLCTAPSSEVGSTLARQLVEEKLAACVNVVPGIRSFYWWDGKVQDDAEVLLVIKTRQQRATDLLARIAALHPYTVPEGIGWTVTDGLQPYLDWVEREAP